MKVVNISLIVYSDGWSYQDNLLPKYQKKLGHDVWMITTDKTYNSEGEVVVADQRRYINQDGVNIIRLEDNRTGLEKVFDRFDLLSELKAIDPDYIFFHNLHFFSVWDVVKYIRRYNERCIFVIDNHEDQYNHSYRTMSLKGKFIYQMYRLNARFFAQYVDKAYGVTNGRVDYLHKVYGIPADKTDILLMGVDADEIQYDKRQEYRKLLQEKYGIDPNDFIIVMGGKLDSNKKVLELIEAFLELSEFKDLKLVIFGSVAKDIKEIFYEKINNSKIVFLGFLSSDDINKLFIASDLGVFPGGHSVLWEQAIGCGLPCIFQHREGMTHVDIGGNCLFLYGEGATDIKNVLKDILNNKQLYLNMKKIALERGMKEFSYYEIAKKSLNVTKRRQ